MSERLWRPGEVAALMRVDPKTITRWVHEGRLPAIRTPGGRYRIPDSAVRDLFTPERGDQS